MQLYVGRRDNYVKIIYQGYHLLVYTNQNYFLLLRENFFISNQT
jgi:hypothetical protein